MTEIRILFCQRCDKLAALHPDDLCDRCHQAAERAAKVDRAQDSQAASKAAFNALLGIEAA